MAAKNESEKPTVAVLGTGIMGAAMASNLLAARMRTVVWDHSPAAMAPLSASGAVVAASPAETVREAQVVITMLPTAEAVDCLVFGGGVVESFAPGAVWAQMGTIGVRATIQIARKLQRLRPDVMFVDAPVSGSKEPARSGHLLILASGPPQAQPIVGPIFSILGRKTVWLGEAGLGSRLKLAINAYLSILVEGVAEADELATQLGVDPARLADAIEGGPLDAPIVEAKLHKIERGDFAPEFPLEWALKDVDLALEAAGDVSLPLLETLSREWRGAVRAGHGREDVSATFLTLGARGP
jgi:3-hydroxyisobutyrate dehydrogenase